MKRREFLLGASAVTMVDALGARRAAADDEDVERPPVEGGE